MNDIHAMCRDERRGDLDRDVDRTLNVYSVPKPLPQGLAFDEFSGDEAMASGLANLMNRHDVWIIKCGSGARFLFEASQPFRIRSEPRGKKFETHSAMQLGIFGEINLAHSTFAKQCNDPVVRYKLARS